MKIVDSLYGAYEIDSSVVIALLNSKPLKRLKKIAQFGIPDDYYHLKNFSRYDHCVGVMLLLKRLGASEEEQIAGLLHDVSHTAFSHVIDWVVGEGKTEGYQDEQHESFVTSSEIPHILQAYGYDAKRITDYHHFGLLERDLPDVCADRADYSLREFPLEIAKKCITHMTTQENKIVFTNKSSALLFARNFLQQQMNHWGGFEAVSRYRIFANMLRLALKENIIHKEDFWKEDAYIIGKLKLSKHKEINKILKILKQKSLADLPQSMTVVHKKFRAVDPLFIAGKKLLRLSAADQAFATSLEAARKKNEKGIIIPQI